MKKSSSLPEDFDVFGYLGCNPDLLRHFCDIDALESHYLNFGLNEGREFNLTKKPRSRWDYKEVWDSASSTFDNAKIGVAGYTDEILFQKSAIESLNYLCEHLSITEHCHVLEIGCGVGRVGKELSNICAKWTGVDASSKMIEFAGSYLSGIENVTLAECSGYDLKCLGSSTFDKVYCIVVFMHLDEWERYNYIKEAFRVLKKGGRLLVNNINIRSSDGWRLFLEHADIPVTERPLNISKTSTSSEIVNYFEKVGFVDIVVSEDETNLWLTVSGQK